MNFYGNDHHWREQQTHDGDWETADSLVIYRINAHTWQVLHDVSLDESRLITTCSTRRAARIAALLLSSKYPYVEY